MKVIVISTSGKKDGEPQAITKMFMNGLQTLHLRKPKFSTNEMRRFIEQIPAEFHNRIVIHSHHNLALRFNLGGIHLTRKHKSAKLQTWYITVRLKFKNPHLLITTSHSSLSNLLDNDKKYNYVFLSPVFDSLTHKYQSGFSQQSLKSALERTHYKVIARSGIDTSVIPKVKELGFYGMAVYSAIWKSADPAEEFEKFIQACKDNGVTVE